MIVLRKGVAECGRLLVEVRDHVAPVALGRDAEQSQGSHRSPQVGPGITGEAEEVACGFVKKEPRRVEMLVGRAALEVLHETYAGVRRARAKRTLVLDRRTPGAQVRVGSESGLGRSGHQIRLLELVELDGNLLVLRAVVAKIWIIGEPSHAVPVHGVPCGSRCRQTRETIRSGW